MRRIKTIVRTKLSNIHVGLLKGRKGIVADFNDWAEFDDAVNAALHSILGTVIDIKFDTEGQRFAAIIIYETNED